MSRKVLILDTSVLCCWLQIPDKDTAGPIHDQWDHNRINQLLKSEAKKGSTFVLPVATLIETGNFIAQCNGDRYSIATKLTEHLKQSLKAESPWAAFTDQSILWEQTGLSELARNWPTLAAKKISIGDATIKHVAEHYASAGMTVEILTGDLGLKSYEPIKKSIEPRRRR